jgi:uncharacterized YigZ family protein
MICCSSDEYLTIKNSVRSKTKVEGSVFIAAAIPVDSEAAADDYIRKISREFFDATHNCFAYRIKKTKDETSKFSDAGEPRGTAGKPILSAIQSEDLYNILIVVTRYFGGVKLGTGGLSRAYRQCAQAALQKAEKLTKVITAKIALSYPPGLTGKVNQVFARVGARVKGQGFEDAATAEIEVRASRREKIKEALVEATNGQVKFK